MNEHEKHGIEPLDRELWDLLEHDEAPDLHGSVWPDVRARTTSDRRTGWLDRAVWATAAAACLAVGLLAGLNVPGGEAGAEEWLTVDELVEGSVWSGESWSLDGLYAAAGENEGGTR